jgi:hypothetical protein
LSNYYVPNTTITFQDEVENKDKIILVTSLGLGPQCPFCVLFLPQRAELKVLAMAKVVD